MANRTSYFSNIKVAHKLAMLLGFLLLGFVVIGVTYIQADKVAIEVNEDNIRLLTLANEIEVSVLEMRRQEKNFLLRKDPSVLVVHARTLDALQKNIEALGEEVLDIKADDQIAPETNEEDQAESSMAGRMSASVAEYRLFFDALVKSQTDFGLSDASGVRHQLNQALESIKASAESENVDLLDLAVSQVRGAQLGYLNEPGDRMLTAVGDAIQILNDEIDRAGGLSLQAAELLHTSVDDYQGIWPEVLSLAAGMGDAEQSFQAAVSRFDPLLKELRGVARELRQAKDAEYQEQRAFVTLQFLTVLIVISVVVCLALALLSRSITRGLSSSVAILESLAEGDLRIGATGESSTDEFGQLIATTQEMRGSLSNVISNTRLAALNVASAAEQVSHGNRDLSSRTQEHASSLEEVAATMEEMTSTVKQNADNSTEVNKLAVGARTQAETGREVTNRAVGAMKEVTEASKRISDIIVVIDEIAFQTNLLALNAAVEAARAGDQGRGFAVVATEVRNLAQRSSSAAKEIKKLINDTVERVAAGSEHINESGEALEEIVKVVASVGDAVAAITLASREQTASIEQVNQSLIEMESMTQQNASMVEEASAASHSMTEQAMELTELVSFFQLDHSLAQQDSRDVGASGAFLSAQDITSEIVNAEAVA